MAEQELKACCAHPRLNRIPIYSSPGLVVAETWACSECGYEPTGVNADPAVSALTARLSSAEAEVERLRKRHGELVDWIRLHMFTRQHDVLTRDEVRESEVRQDPGLADIYTAAARRQQGGTDAR